MASGPDQPPAGLPRLAATLARHRWAAAAGMTATIAVVAGGGLALALHDSAAAPPKECGLVPCAAALPASVQSSGDESASAPAAATPTAAQRASTPPGLAHSPTPPAASATAPGATAPGATAPAATAPRATPPAATPPAATAPGVAAPAATAPQATAPPDQPVSAGRVFVPDPRFSCTTVIAFVAGDTLSPVRCRFTDSASHQHSRDRSGHPGSGVASENTGRAGGQLGSGPGGHGDWLGSWLHGLSRGWPGTGWPGTGWPGGGWSGQHGGGSGQHDGWPGGR